MSGLSQPTAQLAQSLTARLEDRQLKPNLAWNLASNTLVASADRPRERSIVSGRRDLPRGFSTPTPALLQLDFRDALDF